MSVKNICMVTIHSDPLEPLGSEEAGGQNVYVKELSTELAGLGVDVDVYTRWVGGKPQIEEICPGARVIRIRCGPKEKIKKEELYIHLNDFLTNTLRFIRRNKIQYDLVHGHYWMGGTVSVDLANELRIPHIQIFHSLGKLKQQVLDSEEEYNYGIRILNEKRAMDSCSLIVTESNVEKQQIMDYYSINRNKIGVIPGGVNRRFHQLDKDKCRRELDIPEGLMVLYLGRITPRKGTRYFVEAVPEILKKTKRDDVFFYVLGGHRQETIPGEGFEDKEFEAINKKLKKDVRDRLTFTGPMDNEITPKYYSAADVIVIPSLYEPFGLVAVEALGCGLPAVATNLGGLSETIDDGVNGFLVPPKDSHFIAQAVSTLLSNPELRKKFSANGRRKIDRSYRWDVIAKKMLKLYRKARYLPPEENKKRKTVLFAADLDGTLVDESTPKIIDFFRRLKKIFKKHDIQLKLAYNTNRSLNLKDSSFRLINEYRLPWPDYLIANVGTELYRFDGYFKYHRGWNQLMAKTWNKKAIESLKIHELDGLEVTHDDEPFKISFRLKRIDDLRLIGEIYDLLIDQPAKVVLSQKRLIDIIPKNAGKGRCLDFLARKSRISKRNIIVFGNDSSDLDVFSSGFGFNVLIGSADKPVKYRLMEVCTEERYITKKEGAEGVVEGAIHFLPQLLSGTGITQEEIDYVMDKKHFSKEKIIFQQNK